MAFEKENTNGPSLSFIESLVNGNKEIAYLNGNEYINNLLGIHFKFPGDWFVVSVNQFPNLINQQILSGEYEHYKNELYKALEQPSLLISKYDINSNKYHGLVSPVLNFNIIVKEQQFRGLTLIQYADLLDSQEGFGYHMLKKFKITNKGKVFNQGGHDFVIYDTEYFFEHEEMDEGIMVEMSVLNIDYGDFFLDFSMTQCKSQNQIAIDEFSGIIKSIRLNYQF